VVSDLGASFLNSRLSEHLQAGPIAVRPLGQESDWLIEELKLGRFDLGKDPSESMALFVPRPESLPSRTMPLIRKFSWNRLADLRAKKKPPSLPTVTSSYYEVRPADFPSLDDAVKGVDIALAKFPYPVEGIAWEQYYAAGADEPVGHGQAAFSLKSIKRKLPAINIELEFEDHAPSPFQDAWNLLWAALDELCKPVRLSEGCEESWDISPERFLQLLGKAN
jgi:hypothetical protein